MVAMAMPVVLAPVVMWSHGQRGGPQSRREIRGLLRPGDQNLCLYKVGHPSYDMVMKWYKWPHIWRLYKVGFQPRDGPPKRYDMVYRAI